MSRCLAEHRPLWLPDERERRDPEPQHRAMGVGKIRWELLVSPRRGSRNTATLGPNGKTTIFLVLQTPSNHFRGLAGPFPLNSVPNRPDRGGLRSGAPLVSAWAKGAKETLVSQTVSNRIPVLQLRRKMNDRGHTTPRGKRSCFLRTNASILRPAWGAV